MNDAQGKNADVTFGEQLDANPGFKAVFEQIFMDAMSKAFSNLGLTRKPMNEITSEEHRLIMEHFSFELKANFIVALPDPGPEFRALFFKKIDEACSEFKQPV